ncbi:hypothetical protein Syun_002963 [Stephania yunnanensis]|uniref:Uncharacterized protein n=1 Tax=Stephania yunnanensis TaxID=152371 RepID=A0AAP0L0I5_9MAGN
MTTCPSANGSDTKCWFQCKGSLKNKIEEKKKEIGLMGVFLCNLKTTSKKTTSLECFLTMHNTTYL